MLGAGGVGGLIAACLARNGAPVTLVVRPESLAHYPAQMQLESPFGNFTVPVARAAEVPSVDVLWITTKATQLEPALTAITHPESVGRIVPLLNGVDHIALLRSKYGAAKIIPATIAVESERVAPGHIIHRSPFARLSFWSQGKCLLGATADHLQKMSFECRFVDDEPTLLWSKLIFLSAFALSTTAFGCTTGEILGDPERRELALGCMREASAVAIAEGAKIDVDAMIAGVMKMPLAMRSSMQKDVERGNPPELDAIAGPILRGGPKHGIAVPSTQKLVGMVEQKVAASRPLSS